jgi:hypothetical protein
MPKPVVLAPGRGRKPRSPLEDHAAWVLELIEEADLTLEIEQRLWAGRGVRTTDSSIDRR